MGWRRGQVEQLPVRSSPLGRGRLFKNMAKRRLEEEVGVMKAGGEAY